MADSKNPKDKQQEKNTISQKPTNLSPAPVSASSTAQKRKSKDDVELPSKKGKATPNKKSDNKKKAVSSAQPGPKTREDWENFFMNNTSEYRAKMRKSFQEEAAAVEAALEEARKESEALDEQIAFASKVRDQAVAIQEAYNENLSSFMNMAKKLRMRNGEVYKLRVGWNGELEVKEEETELIDEVDADYESDGDQEEDEFDDPYAQWLAEM